MKLGRWCTTLGSIVLFLVGVGHGLKFSQLEAMIQASTVKQPLDGIVRGCWLILATEMAGIALIAFVASRLERGARVVLLCGLILMVNTGLLLKFVGLFVGVYLTLFVMIMFLVGGLLQSQESA